MLVFNLTLSNYLQKRDYANAQMYAQHALQKLTPMDDVDKQTSTVFFTLGRIALMQGDYIQAETQLTTAVDIARGTQSPTQFARIFTALAIALHRQNKHKASEQAYLEAMQILDGTTSLLDKVRLRLSLGALYVDMQQFNNAETLFLEAEHALKTISGQLPLLAMTANNLGNVLLEKETPVAAEFHLRRSVELRRSLNIRLPLANSCKSWGKALYQLGRYREAIVAIDESMSILSDFEDDAWAKSIVQECITLRKACEAITLS